MQEKYLLGLIHFTVQGRLHIDFATKPCISTLNACIANQTEDGFVENFEKGQLVQKYWHILGNFRDFLSSLSGHFEQLVDRAINRSS